MVYFLHIPAALVLLILSSISLTAASSSPSRPLKTISHPSTLALEILPRTRSLNTFQTRNVDLFESPILRHTDTFRLTLSVFGETYHLHLRPNDQLIHPSARIRYYRNGPDGQAVLDRTEPLLPQSVKAYWGEVVSAERSSSRLKEDAAGVIRKPHHPPELGWARIMVHHQGNVANGIPPHYEGAFTVNGVVHHIVSKENYLRNKHYLDPTIELEDDDPESRIVIFRDSDIMTEDELRGITAYVPTSKSKCSHDSLEHNTSPSKNRILRPSEKSNWYDAWGILETATATVWENDTMLTKRDDVAGGGMGTNFVNSIGQTTGCSSTPQIIYMGVAADCQYTTRYGSQQAATTQILNDWNSASSLYKSTFNVSLGIIHIEVHEATCPDPVDQTRPWNTGCGNVTLNDRLSLFSQWRGTVGDDGTGLWHLMSGCPTGTEVGVAWLGTLCQQDASGDAPSVVSGTAVSTNGNTEWQVVAHEIGHNFGAIHDCTDGCNSTTACCPLTADTCDANDGFIMSPVTSSSQDHFSQCSIGNICSLMIQTAQNKINATCLQPADSAKQTITLQMCGNGIVESGEDCDPGIGSNSTCCDVSTCRFTSGAVCDPASSPCCTDECQYAPSTQVCRASVDPTCDTAETCTGSSSACPTNAFAPNGESCGDGLTCANGHCTSESLQCQVVGASMNLTTACPKNIDNSCQVSCQDPNNANQCVQLQSQLIDGSACGLGGTCSGGVCQAGSVLDTAKAWYVQNLQISIPVSVVVGIVLLLLVYALILAIKRCRVQRDLKSAEPALNGQRGARLSGWEPQYLGPNSTRQNMSQLNRNGSRGQRISNQNNWVDARAYNGL